MITSYLHQYYIFGEYKGRDRYYKTPLYKLKQTRFSTDRSALFRDNKISLQKDVLGKLFPTATLFVELQVHIFWGVEMPGVRYTLDRKGNSMW
jgi:hypothetical protein